MTASPGSDECGPPMPLPLICNACGRALANLGEWCCGRFVTAADVVGLAPEPSTDDREGR